ncbi:MAG TPA: hypothetical protein PLU24_06380 [Candidatus Omnitrophota bacterium]|nr:hypothetical protein [Candidatus Omnitrophota bacterium]
MQINEKLSLVFGIPDESFFKTFKESKVFVPELRPGLEGMQVVSKAMLKNKITPIVICDNMMAFCMKRGLVKDVHIFYKSINADSAVCRTGSLIAALCAKAHGINCFLHRESAFNNHAQDLKKIGGKNITSSSIKTYVPETEEVPLASLVRG